MSTEEDKIKRTKRMQKDECAVAKQVKIAKASSHTPKNPLIYGRDVRRSSSPGVDCCSMYARIVSKGAPPQLPAK